MAQCIYSNWNGECGMYDKGDSIIDIGCDKEGNCLVEDDPVPSDICIWFESDEPFDEDVDW